MRQKDILYILSVVGLILLVPLFGNIFIEGWNWGVMDFVFAGIILFVTGLGIAYIAHHVTNPVYRTIAILGVIVAFLLLWVELAVDAVSRTVTSLFNLL